MSLKNKMQVSLKSLIAKYTRRHDNSDNEGHAEEEKVPGTLEKILDKVNGLGRLIPIPVMFYFLAKEMNSKVDSTFSYYTFFSPFLPYKSDQPPIDPFAYYGEHVIHKSISLFDNSISMLDIILTAGFKTLLYTIPIAIIFDIVRFTVKGKIYNPRRRKVLHKSEAKDISDADMKSEISNYLSTIYSIRKSQKEKKAVLHGSLLRYLWHMSVGELGDLCNCRRFAAYHYEKALDERPYSVLTKIELALCSVFDGSPLDETVSKCVDLMDYLPRRDLGTDFSRSFAKDMLLWYRLKYGSGFIRGKSTPKDLLKYVVGEIICEHYDTAVDYLYKLKQLAGDDLLLNFAYAHHLDSIVRSYFFIPKKHLGKLDDAWHDTLSLVLADPTNIELRKYNRTIITTSESKVTRKVIIIKRDKDGSDLKKEYGLDEHFYKNMGRTVEPLAIKEKEGFHYYMLRRVNGPTLDDILPLMPAGSGIFDPILAQHIEDTLYLMANIPDNTRLSSADIRNKMLSTAESLSKHYGAEDAFHSAEPILSMFSSELQRMCLFPFRDAAYWNVAFDMLGIYEDIGPALSVARKDVLNKRLYASIFQEISALLSDPEKAEYANNAIQNNLYQIDLKRLSTSTFLADPAIHMLESPILPLPIDKIQQLHSIYEQKAASLGLDTTAYDTSRTLGGFYRHLRFVDVFLNVGNQAFVDHHLSFAMYHLQECLGEKPVLRPASFQEILAFASKAR